MVATLLADASLLLPPGEVDDNLRWLRTWPEIGPQETFAWLSLPSDASWKNIVEAAYSRFEDHWAAGIACHH
jgi:hypothetical protein